MRRLASSGVLVGLAVVAGFVVRGLFLWRHPLFRGDALVYGELAHHMIKDHVYGLLDGGVLKPTLIRLPGYPAFVAACFQAFGDGNYLSVLWVQVVIDLASCGLIAATVAQMTGRRAGMWALWLAVLCPFTANYSVVVVPECVSIFCVALAFYGLQRVSGNTEQQRSWGWTVVVGLALAGAVLVRPDQGLLAAAVVPALLWVGVRERGREWRVRVAPAVIASAIVVLPLSLWAVRNWRVFHVVQPIAPKYANDPGEEVAYGFMRWYRTWAVGFPSTVKVYWNYDGETISMGDLPDRAFDSAEQHAKTAQIVAQYNDESASTPQVDAEFARLAEQRVRAHPLRYYVELPMGRLLDMWFRPRIEYMKIPLDWWRLRAHPWGAVRAYAMGALNICYLGLACVGVWMWRRRGGVVVWSMVAFVVLRCALLLTIDNSEPRYTMECYSVVIVLAALAISAEKHTSEAEASGYRFVPGEDKGNGKGNAGLDQF